jgi:FtsP/CotA-like multicopper oxidase with cupredoxin domain
MARLMVATVAACVALAGCGGGSEDAAPNVSASANAQDMTPEGPGLAAQLFGGGKPMPLTLQNAHPGGLVLQVNSIQAKATETVIRVTVINGDTDEQMLNQFPTNRNGYLLASNGERLYLSPPTANPELRIGAGQRMEGELVFLGRLSQGGGATLVLNDGRDISSVYSNSPGFRIPIPLQSAAFSDDGSKKNLAA